MAPRSSWKGFIKLSLVSIPVRAFGANASSSEIQLHQLHKECHSRIQYRKVCPVHGEVSRDDIVSGYEYQKGQYVVIEPEEREKLYLQSERSINIDGFLPPDAIDALYYAGRTYYLLPEGPAGVKPYALLREGMQEKGLAAFARVVLFGREELVLLRPLGRLLAMTMVYYEQQVKKPQTFEEELTEPALDKGERRLTSTLIDATTLKEFDLSRYHDSYEEKLKQLIEAKVEGREVVTPPAPEEPRVINLMDALKKSLAQAQGESPRSGEKARAAAAHRKMAPSAHPRPARRKKKLG